MRDKFIILLLLFTSTILLGDINDIVVSDYSDLTFSKIDKFDVISFEEPLFLNDTGKPQLPVILKTFVIPIDKQFKKIVINNENYINISGQFDMYPSQPETIMGEETEFVEQDVSVYGSNNPYPQEKVQIIDSGYMMDYHLITIRICPFEYIPKLKTLKLITSINYTVVFEDNSENIEVSYFQSETRSKSIKKFISSFIDNPGEINSINGGAQVLVQENATLQALNIRSLPSQSGDIPEYVIITNDELFPIFEELANWKTKKGIPTAMITVDEISANYNGCDLQEKIRNYIKEVHLYWGAGLYILLGGDTNIIPERMIKSIHQVPLPSDTYYSTVDGNWNADGDNVFGEGGDYADMYADFFLGRASVENIAEAGIFVNKVITYEKMNSPTINPEYVKNVLLCGPTYASSADSDIFYPYGQQCQEAAYSQLPTHILSPQHYWKMYDDYNGHYVFDEMLNRENFLSAIEDGGNSGLGRFHIVSHYDHGSIFSIGTSSIIQGDVVNRTDIDALNNASPHQSYNILFNHSCSPGRFILDCFGEHWINNPNGLGVAYIGNSESAGAEGYSSKFRKFFEYIYDVNINNGISNLDKAIIYSRQAEVRLHLFGDPEMPVWTNTPQHLIVSVSPAVITNGMNQITVTVSNLVQGYPGRITLMNGKDYYATMEISENGSYTFDACFNQSGPEENLEVTVTSQNFYPFETSFPIQATTGAYAFVSETFINDSQYGDNDQKADAGEIIEVPLELTNSGQIGLSNITMTLSCDVPYSTYITITDNTIIMNSLTSNGSAISNSGFQLEISPNIPKDPVVINNEIVDYRNINLDIVITANGYSFNDKIYLHVNVPEIEMTGIHLTGNELTIGENEFQLELANIGDDEARNLTATLISQSNHIGEISTASQSFIDINPISSGFSEGNFVFDIDSFPSGTGVDFYINSEIQIVSDNGRSWSFPIDLYDSPVQITDLKSQSTDTSIDLSWQSENENKFYNIYSSPTANGEYTKLNLYPIDIKYFRVDDLSSCTTNFFKIEAITESKICSALFPSIGFEAWTSLPFKQDWPITSDVGIEVHGSIVVEDVIGDESKEIFTTIRGSEKGYILGFNSVFTSGPDIYNIDSNPTSISGFAAVDQELWGTPAIADIDNDGIMEVVVATRNYHNHNENYLYAYEVNDSDNNEYPDEQFAPVDIDYDVWRGCVLEDLDADGDMEIIFTDQQGRVRVYDHQGTILSNWNSIQVTCGSDSYGIPAVADLDNDGTMEIIVGFDKTTSINGSIHIWDHDATPYQGTGSQIYASGESFASAPTIADIDADGDLEIIITDSSVNSGNVYVFTKNTSGNYVVMNNWGAGQHTISLSSESEPPVVTVGNIDSDNELEILCASLGCLKAWEYNGNNRTGFPVLVENLNVQSSSILLADVDCDPQIEIIVAELNKKAHCFNSDGSLNTGWPVNFDAEIRSTPCIDDIDNDNKNEFIVGDYTGQVFVWETEGDANKIEWGSYRNNCRNGGVYKNPGEITPISISGNATFENTHISRPVMIPSGSALTVRGNVSFSYDITVEEGGTLVLINGEGCKTLLSPDMSVNVYGDLYLNSAYLGARYNTWKGIKCYPGSNVQCEYNSTIENAIHGIACIGTSGISAYTMDLNGVKIKNCNYGLIAKGTITLDNQCEIANCNTGVNINNDTSLTINNSSIVVPENGKGILKINSLSNSTLLINNSTFTGSSLSNSIGFDITISAIDQNLVIDCSQNAFNNLYTGIRYSTNSRRNDSILNCIFNNCNYGIDLIGSGNLKLIRYCDFNENFIGTRINYLDTKVRNCSFTNNTECGIDLYHTTPSGGNPGTKDEGNFTNEPDIYYCSFHGNPIGIRTTNTSQRISHCNFHEDNNIGVWGGDNSSLYMDYNAENVFRNDDTHIKLFEDATFSADLLLKNGHNDFYEAEYDLSFSSQYESGARDLNLDGNWWGLDYPSTPTNDYSQYISIEGIGYAPLIVANYVNMDTDPNNPFFVSASHRFDYGCESEMNGDLAAALGYFRAIIEDALEEEYKFWEKSIDKSFYITTKLEDDLLELKIFFMTFRDNIPAFVIEPDRSKLVRLADDYIKKIYIEKANYEAAAQILINRIENPMSEADAIFAQMELETLYIISGIGGSKLIKTAYDKMAPKNVEELNILMKDHWAKLNILYNNGDIVNNNIPPTAQLYGNYPNPFNPATTFSFSVPDKSNVKITIYNIKGQRVKEVVDDIFDEGFHKVVWNGTDQVNKKVATGVYFYRFDVNNKTKGVKKCLLLK